MCELKILKSQPAVFSSDGSINAVCLRSFDFTQSQIKTSVILPSEETSQTLIQTCFPLSLLQTWTKLIIPVQDSSLSEANGHMAANHKRGIEGVKGGKHGPVYLRCCHWCWEESACSWVDTNGTTQRWDKPLRLFSLVKFNKPHLRRTGIQHAAFREKVNTSVW